MAEWLLVAAGVVLIGACGVFVAAEFSFVAQDRVAAESAAAAGRRGAAGLVAALRTLSTQLSGAQVGITVTNLAIGYVAEPSLGRLLSGPLTAMGVPAGAVREVAFTVAFLAATAATMIFGELVPKNLAIARPFAVARVVQLPQRAFTRGTRPLTGGLNEAANWIVRRLGVEPREELASARSPQELMALVRHSAEAGTLERPTATLVERSLRFDQKIAADVLMPRTRMVAVQHDTSIHDLLALSRETGLSRFPVYGDSLDEIVGVVALDRAVSVPTDERSRTSVRSVMSEPVLVPDSLALDDLARALLNDGAPLAVVVDEFGGTAGLVTTEDLAEEIVGEIRDEHDRLSSPVRRIRTDSWIVPGLLRPDEVADVTGISLPEEGAYETLGGLILAGLGRLPRPGDAIEVQGVRLEVLRMDRRRIDRVRLTILDDEESNGEESTP